MLAACRGHHRWAKGAVAVVVVDLWLLIIVYLPSLSLPPSSSLSFSLPLVVWCHKQAPNTGFNTTELVLELEDVHDIALAAHTSLDNLVDCVANVLPGAAGTQYAYVAISICSLPILRFPLLPHTPRPYLTHPT